MLGTGEIIPIDSTPDVFGSGVNSNVTRNGFLTGVPTGTLNFHNQANVAPTLNLGFQSVIEAGGILATQAPRLAGGTLTSGAVAGGFVDLFVHASADSPGISPGNSGLRLQSRLEDNFTLIKPLRLVKAQDGVLSLENDNFHTGGTIVGNGTVIVGSGPNGSSIGSLGSGDVLVNGVLAFDRAGFFTIANNVNAFVNGGGSVAQYSGFGVLRIEQAMKLGGLRAEAGAIQLNFDSPFAPASQLIDGSFTTGPTTIHTARLTFRNGRLEIFGKNLANTVQDFAITDLQGRGAIQILPIGLGSSVTLNLGSLVRTSNSADGGATLSFDFLDPLSTITMGSITSGSTVIPTTANALIAENGMAFVSVSRTDWGAKGANNRDIVAGSSIPGFYTDTGNFNSIPAGNADLSNTAADPFLNMSQNTASLRFSRSSGPGTITLDGGAALGLGGILVSQSTLGNDTTIQGTGPLGGTIRAMNTGQRDLPIFHHGAGKLSIAVPVANPAGGATHLVKGGFGIVEMTALNTYTGRTFVNEGVLRVTGTGQLGSVTTPAGSIFVRSGALEVLDSARVYAPSISIGQRVGDFGVLAVRDTGFVNALTDLNVGDVNARGDLFIESSAQVVTTNLFIGKHGYSVGRIVQTGSSAVSATLVQIGGADGSSTAAEGTYELSGFANVSAFNVDVGANGRGTINQTGGFVFSSGEVSIGRYMSGNGQWNISGGVLSGVIKSGTRG